MSRILRSPQAWEDLVQAAEFICQDSPKAAEKFIDSVDEKLALLAENPLIGRERPELYPKLRSFPLKSHVIFYLPLEDGVHVIRLLHGHQDIENLF